MKDNTNTMDHSDAIEWSDAMSVGIQEIDEQHKVLVDIITELHTAIKQKHSSRKVVKILSRLTDYTKTHFMVEESILRIMKYPDYEDHKKQHDRLVKKMSKLKTKVEEGNTSIGFELSYMLKMWLVNHIQISDKDHSQYLLKKGVSAHWKKKSIIDRIFG